MKVAVTGASGFVGRYVVRALTAARHDAVALGRSAAAMAPLHAPGVSVQAVTYEEHELIDALAGVDAIVHLAGRRTQREDPPMRLWPFAEPNVRTFDNLLHAAARNAVSRIVFLSSIAVYSSANASPYRESDPARPLNPYGLSKLCGEELLAFWQRRTGIKASVLRVAALYGDGERISAVMMKFVSDAQAKRTLKIKGNPHTTVEQLYVKDAVAAVMAALGDGSPGGVFNIGPGGTFSLLGMAQAVNDAFDNRGNLEIEDRESAEPRLAAYLDVEKAARALGWRPQFGLAEGLRDMRNISLGHTG